MIMKKAEKTKKTDDVKEEIDVTLEDQNQSSSESEEKIISIEKERNEWKEKFVRLYSEYENFRKRTAKEKIDLSRTATEKLMIDLLSVLDDFDRAKENNEKVEDPKIIKEGVDLIYNKLFKSLESKGLKPMDSKETPFDVDLHDAITNIPAPTKNLKGKVVDVVEKGYYLNDHVLRFAKVVVGQ
jgi:molecular chaperone GrpE